MSGYRIRDTGEYLATRSALEGYRVGKGGVPIEITTSWLDSIGMDGVLEGPQAQPTDHYGYSQFAGLEQIDGKWFTKYIVGPVFQDTPEATAAEQMAAYKAGKDKDQANNIRNDRNQRLKDCDWLVIKALELGQAVPENWATYRQALRDVPTQAVFPWNVEWPVQPE